MLSGNGRHRRPRQAPALLVAAGVTGSAIAIPLLGAASAHAADGTTWDKVAECESGGSWSADGGNGYYGGLQISQDDWDTYGGTRYAESADQASRSQQIAVAERILADQGTKPWATCALTAGLTSHSGSVDVDTGVGGSGDSDRSGDSGRSNDGSGSADDSDSSGLSDSSSSGSDSGSGPDSGSRAGADGDSGSNSGSGSDASGSDASGSDSSGSSSSHATGTPGPGASEGATKDPKATGGATGTGTATPKSDKTDKPDPAGGGSRQGGDTAPTETPGVDESDNSRQAAGSWSLVDTGTLGSGGRHRGESADESAANGQDAEASGRHADQARGIYIVREGDTLVAIADSLGVHGGWHALYDGNKKVIGADPNHITAGQTLKVGGEKGDK
ncbi:peptigoglycan-binding protein LysM [Streptomyces yokosukanensis]|uniref:Peptigoglycan-binding protein LysM n=1 Tax=Streptomyces yokosukanensis TaxID=67386 RepID=A0A101P840_9ACTN|nr:transglycosylase family protein [Streptomyces yokosukanensis]KUN06662.1 peptigoglycan-binding protein LysM [Streptomyces yokosukanensis]